MASDPRLDRRWGLLTLAAVAVGAALRVVGLGYGLPHVYNPDEVAIMNRAMGLGQNGLNPHNFLYPSLYFYALFACEGAWFVVGRLAGIFGSLSAFEHAFFTDPTTIYLAGRALTMACGVATIAATWRLGSRLFGPAAGTAAAWLLAVTPLAVRDAHYVKHDVPVTWLVVLTYAVLTGEFLLPGGRRRWWLPAAVAGLAMSTHYYAIFLALPLTLVVVAPIAPGEPMAPRARRLVLAGLVTAAAFLAASPFLLAEPGTAIRDVVANRQIVVDRATTSTGAFGFLAWYVRWLVIDGVGVGTSLLAVAGLAALGGRGWRLAAIVGSFPLAFLLFIANTVPASRYLNPIVPFVVVLAGAGAAWLLARTGWMRVVGAFVVAAALVEGTAASARVDVFMRQTDTRTQALAWIDRELPPGTSILVQPYSVPLPPTRDALTEALTANLGAASRASVKFQRMLALTPYPAPAYRPIYLGAGGLDVDKIYVAPADIDHAGTLEPLRHLAVTYVVLKRYNVEDPSMTTLTTALRREARRVAEFSPYRPGLREEQRESVPPFLHNTDARIAPALERPGPTIEIWRID